MSEPRLVRLAGDFVTWVQAIAGVGVDAGLDAPRLRAALIELLDRAAKSAAAAGIAQGEIDEARFALVAWADEVILKAPWPGREGWLREPLQQQLYRTTRAGNEFFEHLAGLRADQIQAREVYWLVLALGFEGQYQGQQGERRALLAQQYEVLRASRRLLEAGREAQLSPGAYALDIELPRARGGGFGVGVAALTVVGTLLLVYGALYWLLQSLGGEIPLPRGL